MTLNTPTDHLNASNNGSAKTAEVHEHFAIVPFKDNLNNENLDYAMRWLQYESKKFNDFVSRYFFEHGKVEKKKELDGVQYKALLVVIASNHAPLRATVNMDGMRACLADAKMHHEKIIAAMNNLQVYKDDRFVQLNNSMVELSNNYQSLIDEMQKFINPEKDAEIEAEQNASFIESQSREVTAKISTLIGRVDEEHSQYKEAD